MNYRGVEKVVKSMIACFGDKLILQKISKYSDTRTISFVYIISL